MQSIDRTTGMLLGAAVGDAMGGPLAFLSEEQVRIKHGAVTEMIGGGWLDARPGETTDQFELVMRLGESLVERGEFDRLDVAMRYVDALEARPMSLDNITVAALRAIEAGAPVEEAGRAAVGDSGSDGCTSAPLARCMPLAAFFASDDEALVRATSDEVAMTHALASARSGACTVNLFASRFLRGATGFDAVFDEVEGLLRDGTLGVRKITSAVRDLDERELRDSADSADTLDRALWSLYWGDSFEEVVVRSVRRGGPAHLVGAVAGALAGAFHGVSAIPERWLRTLEGRARIEALAGSLHGR